MTVDLTLVEFGDVPVFIGRLPVSVACTKLRVELELYRKLLRLLREEVQKKKPS